MFLAIIGFIFLGFNDYNRSDCRYIPYAFNSGEKGLGIPESLMFIPVLILAVVYFFPVLSCSVFRSTLHMQFKPLINWNFIKLLRILNPILYISGFYYYYFFTLYCRFNCCRIFNGFLKGL